MEHAPCQGRVGLRSQRNPMVINCSIVNHVILGKTQVHREGQTGSKLSSSPAGSAVC